MNIDMTDWDWYVFWIGGPIRRTVYEIVKRLIRHPVVELDRVSNASLISWPVIRASEEEAYIESIVANSLPVVATADYDEMILPYPGMEDMK